jgi:hypothetical protein
MVSGVPSSAWLPTGLWIAGAVVFLVGLACLASPKSKVAAVVLIIAGVLAAVLGVIFWALQQQASAAAPPCLVGSSGSAGDLGAVGFGTAPQGLGAHGGGASGGGGASSPHRSLSWSPTVDVKPFSVGDTPQAVASTPVHKEVMAGPPAEAPAEPQEEAAADPAAVPPAVNESQANAVAGAAAAVTEAAADVAAARVPFWANLPNPNVMAEERQRFWARPDTPALDWKRRETGLREAAAGLKPMRDGSMVPIAGPTIISPDPALQAVADAAPAGVFNPDLTVVPRSWV